MLLNGSLNVLSPHINLKGRDPMIMGYFDNLDNGSSNKYEINFQNRKKLL
jgi:hypothetical protein